MHKNLEITQLAKALKKEMAAKGLAVSHTQAMSIVANRMGARSLQAVQARLDPKTPTWTPRELDQFATREAGAWMFSSLGRFENNVKGLIRALSDSFLHEHSRDIEHAVHNVLEQGNFPRIHVENCGQYRIDELPGVFDRKVAEIKALAAKLLSPEVSAPGAPGDEVLFSGTVKDWYREEGGDDDLSENQLRDFTADVKRNGSQFYVDISLPHASPDEIEGTDQMSLFIEINQGLPCVHITNSIFGDQVLTIFATKDGLYLRPDSSDLHICTGTPRSESLVALKCKEQSEGKLPHLTANHAFIESSNT